VYNYSNERLQLACKHYILQLEQKDYSERGIDVPEITFTDNSDCIASFEQVCRVDLDVEGPWPGDTVGGTSEPADLTTGSALAALLL
jgi:hypothetical protein